MICLNAKNLEPELTELVHRMRITFLILVVLAVTTSIGVRRVNGQNAAPAKRISSVSTQCSGGNNPAILKEIDRILRRNISYYKEFPLMGFFVYDLTDPANSYISRRYGESEQGCITFSEGHVYHFSTLELAASKSQIAIVEGGRLKVFASINCKSGRQGPEGVLRYVDETISDKDKQDTITRLKHYRRYGQYRTIDQTEYRCREAEIPPNSDKLYSRRAVLQRFSSALRDATSGTAHRNYPDFLIEEERAVGFFVYDLTDPSNKQTSLLERIEFKDGHVYHFADIDLPFSFSHIAILDGGNLKIFRTVNCAGKGESLEDVVRYLNEKLKGDKDKDEIIRRVKNYGAYGVYASVNGLSTPQCASLPTLSNPATPR